MFETAGPGRFGFAIVDQFDRDFLSFVPGDFQALWRFAFDRFAHFSHRSDGSVENCFVVSTDSDSPSPRIADFEQLRVTASIETSDQLRRNDFLGNGEVLIGDGPLLVDAGRVAHVARLRRFEILQRFLVHRLTLTKILSGLDFPLF